MQLLQDPQKTSNVTKDLKQIKFGIKLQHLTEYVNKDFNHFILYAIILVRQEFIHSAIIPVRKEIIHT